MKTLTFFRIILLVSALVCFSCSQDTILRSDGPEAEPVTRAYGDKSPKVFVYVETNDTNPLNAGDYMLSDGKPLIDVVEFFAANIHRRTVGWNVEPTLYLNPELTRLLEPDPADPGATGYHKYVKGLQEKGIKVLVTVIGDWQGIGLSTMNSTQTTQFAKILAHAVTKYDLDGIGLSDVYANSNITSATSYSEIITKLHALMPADKLITVFDWGNTGTINAEAKACIDYSYHGYFGTGFYGSGLLEKARWSPVSTNLGFATNPSTLNSLARRTKVQGYGGFMFFNLRRSSETNPLNMFSATGAGLYDGLAVTNLNGDRAQDWTFVPAGYEINMDEVQ